MLSAFTLTALLLATLLPQSGHASPYSVIIPIRPGNDTICDRTESVFPNCNNTFTPPENHCHYAYPSDLAVVNSRYPDYNLSRLHNSNSFFQLRRQIPDIGEIATRVQFTDLPTTASNTTCRLEFMLPLPQLQTIAGFNPSFNVYHVQRAPDTIATWRTYEGNSGAELFGMVNGDPDALFRTRSNGGVTAINATGCDESLTFQMGMAFNSRDGRPNYWEFTQVSPPAWPFQGFRMVWGC